MTRIDIPINGPVDVILLIIVAVVCVLAVRIIMSFFRKPAPKHTKNADVSEAETIDAESESEDA